MQTTNLFVDNRWDTSTTSEGTIKYLREGSTTTPAICVKRWQSTEFIPFDELSATQWMRHRNIIAAHFKPPVQHEEKKDRITVWLHRSWKRYLWLNVSNGFQRTLNTRIKFV